MAKVKFSTLACLILLIAIWGAPMAPAETVEGKEDQGGSILSINADLVSRYVARGIETSRHVSLQPALSLNFGGFSLGGWGSYPLNFESEKFDETDFWLSYSVESPGGTITIGAMDYFFPASEEKFGNFKNNNEGAHTVELNALYAGTESFPINGFVALNVYNDTSHSIYGELGYSFSFLSLDFNLAAGGATGMSEWNGVAGNNLQITNLSLGIVKEVLLLGKAPLPLDLSFIYNHHTESGYLVFKTGF
jgi:hypothetical protein